MDELRMVVWRDAHFELDPGFTEGPDDFLVSTCGWVELPDEPAGVILPGDGPKFVTVWSEKLPDEGGYRARTRIPVDNVVDWWPLVDMKGLPLTPEGGDAV